MRIGDTVVMLSDAVEGWPSVPSHVHIYVEDVDAVFARAIAAGAAPVRQPVKGGDADKRGGFTDAGGTTWWVPTQVDEQRRRGPRDRGPRRRGTRHRCADGHRRLAACALR